MSPQRQSRRASTLIYRARTSKFLTSGSRMIISEQNLVYGVIR